jgi:hypothetical protein
MVSLNNTLKKKGHVLCQPSADGKFTASCRYLHGKVDVKPYDMKRQSTAVAIQFAVTRNC